MKHRLACVNVLGGKSSTHKRLAAQKIVNVEELETLPAGKMPRTSIAWRRAKRKISLERTRERAIVSQTNTGAVL